LIPVFGKAMAVQAIEDLPNSKFNSIVLRSDMPDLETLKSSIMECRPNAIIITVPNVTEGQACSALIGLNALEKSEGIDISPVTFGTCDSGVIYNQDTYKALINNADIDVIVWGVRGHTNAVRMPNMFGWIDAGSNGVIHNISVKKPLTSLENDPIVIGTFTFKRASDARRAIDTLISRNGRINGEFYLDSCINDAIALGMRCHLFEVDSFISWGTPNELKTFEYWQSCFHKWPGHSYRIENEPRVNGDELENILYRFKELIPFIPP
jgi:hypothetical protein